MSLRGAAKGFSWGATRQSRHHTGRICILDSTATRLPRYRSQWHFLIMSFRRRRSVPAEWPLFPGLWPVFAILIYGGQRPF